MITNNFLPEVEAKLAHFFNKIFDPVTLAKSLRQINFLLALSLMRECKTLEPEKTNVENGYYWLNTGRNFKSLFRCRIIQHLNYH